MAATVEMEVAAEAEAEVMAPLEEVQTFRQKTTAAEGAAVMASSDAAEIHVMVQRVQALPRALDTAAEEADMAPAEMGTGVATTSMAVLVPAEVVLPGRLTTQAATAAQASALSSIQ